MTHLHTIVVLALFAADVTFINFEAVMVSSMIYQFALFSELLLTMRAFVHLFILLMYALNVISHEFPFFECFATIFTFESRVILLFMHIPHMDR